jgi:V-type H+-transporting ATPase subunit C
MYWLVSLPLLDSGDRTWNLLQNKTTYETDLSINYRFEIPELRVGTLDSLMVLSDDLVKVNALVESVVNKIRRQLFEMQGPVCITPDRSCRKALLRDLPL